CSAGGTGIPAGDGGGLSDGSSTGGPDANDGSTTRDGSSDGGDTLDSTSQVDGPGGGNGTRAHGPARTLGRHGCHLHARCGTGVCHSILRACGCGNVVGSRCDRGPDCCPGTGCSLDTAMCCRDVGPCKLNTDCCSGYCPNGTCA